MNQHNYLYLIWKDPNTRKNFIVGKLSKKENEFIFEYCNDYKDAQSVGWDMIQAFPEEKKYKSEVLFPFFCSRLPDKKRKNIDDILNKYGLDSFDGFELLRKSGGRLPIDTYELVDPIFDEDKTIERSFYIVGIRHSCGCDGEDCTNRPSLSVGMELFLKQEPTNAYDRYAILVLSANEEIIGYIPRYFSQSISDRLNNNMTYECKIIEIADNKSCQECVKVRLLF